MEIQVTTDKHIQGGAELTSLAEAAVTAALGRFADQLTRVEAHLTDENSHKSRGDDKKCVMEARPRRRRPVAVTHLAATTEQALSGAAGKLGRLLETTFGRRDRVKGGAP